LRFNSFRHRSNKTASYPSKFLKQRLAIGSLVNGYTLSAGCNWSECEGRQYKRIPLGIFTLSLKCHPASSTPKTTLFSGPTFQCWAKSFKTRSKSWLL